MRRPLVALSLGFLTLAMVNVDAEARWIHAHRVGLLQLAFVGLALFFAIGAFVIDRLAPASRSREVSPRHPARPGRSLPRTGDRVRASRTLAGGSRRARGSFTAAPGRRPPNSRQGLGGPWL